MTNFSKKKIISQKSSSNSGGGGITSVVGGTNITIDNTDPSNPIINGVAASSIIVVANYSALPAPNTVTGKFYWCSASQGTSWIPGSSGGTYYSAGLYYSNGTTWEYLNVPYQATQAEVNAGINTDKFLTPSTFQNSEQLNNKEPAITATTNVDFWSGAKTFINFASTVRSSVLTGLSLATNQVIAATDSVLAALGYLQAQITAWPSATQTLTNKTLTDAIVGTQSPNDNSTKAASTAYVDAATPADFDYVLMNSFRQQFNY